MLQRPAYLAVTLFALLTCGLAQADDPVSLMAPREAKFGWSFTNGAEFPGATGELAIDADAQRDGRDSLKLVGDFTKGGAYVGAGRRFKEVDVRELSFWARNPDSDHVTLLLNDAGGQTHKFVLKTERGNDWQRLVLPLEQFFARRGRSDAVTNVARYESWGGAKDQLWHGPATGLHITLDRPAEADGKIRRFWFQDVAVLPRVSPVSGGDVATVVRLDEVVEGEHDWQFTRHEEFPGAKGALTLIQDETAPGKSYLKLAGDFTGGGAAVAALKSLKSLDVKDVTEIRLQVKSDNATAVGVQLVDASGQTHQRKGIVIKADGRWHELTIKPKEIAGGEHWGGANDAKWHGPATLLSLALASNADPTGKQPVAFFADVRAEVLTPVFVQPPAFAVDFEGAEKLRGWTIVGDAAIDAKTAFKGAHSLVLTRTLDSVEKPCSAVGPSFKVAPGQWLVRLACKSDLQSRDDSYNGVVSLECLDDAGKVVENLSIAERFGQRDWQEVSKRIEVPKGVASAQLRIQLNKSHGRFWVDELSAAYIAPAASKDDRIARLLFSTAQLGNLLFPDDPRRVAVTVEAFKPLRPAQRILTSIVRDYWGAEQTPFASIVLEGPEKKANRYVYTASVDLGGAPLEVGRYYELHASLPQEGGEPFRNYTSFAILPKAVTKAYKPEEVPFTSRAWDNRNAEYIRLSDRLGIRVCGIWGGWSAKPPYDAEAPGLDLCKELGMGWLTGTPIQTIERGKKEYDEKALRQGVRNLIEKYGKARPMIIDLGNEPHGAGEVVRANVEAYRVVYEEIKKVDPNIVVVATAVEPNEEYFKAGYGKWCDVYDFHIYESAEDVRRTAGEYRALMKKYGQEKPLWSTELGLNSQGETRHAVAVELTRKFTTFFAAGGANVSWFGLLYPDPEGKLQGTSGDSHNVFDCRYNRYCPRLDAIAYYNAVNAIAVKKFVEEKTYPGGVHAFLFRDSEKHCLQVLWKDRGRQDVSIPLPEVQAVEVIRVDGSRRALQAAGTGVTLTVGTDPLLLLYNSEAALAVALDEPRAAMGSPPASVTRTKAATLTVSLADAKGDDVELIAPPFWTVKKTVTAGEKPTATFTLTPPEASAVRELDVTIVLLSGMKKPRGELYFRYPVAP